MLNQLLQIISEEKIKLSRKEILDMTYPTTLIRKRSVFQKTAAIGTAVLFMGIVILSLQPSVHWCISVLCLLITYCVVKFILLPIQDIITNQFSQLEYSYLSDTYTTYTQGVEHAGTAKQKCQGINDIIDNIAADNLSQVLLDKELPNDIPTLNVLITQIERKTKSPSIFEKHQTSFTIGLTLSILFISNIFAILIGVNKNDITQMILVLSLIGLIFLLYVCLFTDNYLESTKEKKTRPYRELNRTLNAIIER